MVLLALVTTRYFAPYRPPSAHTRAVYPFSNQEGSTSAGSAQSFGPYTSATAVLSFAHAAPDFLSFRATAATSDGTSGQSTASAFVAVGAWRQRGRPGWLIPTTCVQLSGKG